MAAGHTSREAGPQKKTKLCNYHSKGNGKCKNGIHCSFAHGEEQLGDVRHGNAYPVEESWRAEFKEQWRAELESSDVLTLGIFNRQAHFVFNRFVCL